MPWQRCIFHLAQNAQHHVPNKSLRAEITGAVRDIYQSPSKEAAQERMKSVLKTYESKAEKFCQWLEENFGEGMTFYQFPRALWKKIRTVNYVERLNQEIRRRTRVARLFPNEQSCLRLVSAILIDTHENWVTGRQYLAVG